jgi:hypothetical protein
MKARGNHPSSKRYEESFSDLSEGNLSRFGRENTKNLARFRGI